MKYVVIWALIFGFLIGRGIEEANAQQKNVRKAYVAGQFYPGTREALTAQIQEYLDLAETTDIAGPLHALIVPHAGYIYSGPIAAYAYKQITNPFKRVFLFASNHFQLNLLEFCHD